MRIKYVRCPTCHRKRRCKVTEDYDFQYWVCSKGHEWNIKLLQLDRINRLFKDIYQAAIIAEINTPSPLVSILHV
jgi:hypothetical protein